MMKLKLFRILTLLLAFAMLIPMAACGKKQTQLAGAEATRPEDIVYDSVGEVQMKGTFELQIFVGGYGAEPWEYAIAEFQKLHPELEIVAHLDPNVNAQFKTRWAKDNPPDFVFLEGTNIPTETWMAEGKLRDLKPLFETGKVYGSDKLLKEQIQDGLVFEYGSSGKVYQLPILLSTYGMWYDAALFDQKGWNVPTNYSELLSFSSGCEAAGIEPLIYTGKYSGYAVWGLLMPAVAANAMESNDYQYFLDVCTAKDSSVWEDERFRSALQKIDDLAAAGYFDMGSLSLDHINSQVAWLNHEAALIPNGFWLESEMSDKTPEGFQIRYYPSMTHDADQKPCIIASAVGMGIAEKAKNPYAAEAFIRFLYTDEIMKVFAEKCSTPVATNTDMSGANLSDTAKQVNTMLQSEEVLRVAKAGTSWGSVDGTMNECINNIIDGKYSVDDAIEALKKATDKKNG